MVRKLEGFPQEGELVIATVTSIQYHSVFCRLDEYGKSGMIHISEVAPGRIRSIGEYLREGKTVVVKVLRVDERKGHIDLSLRRVTEAQRRQKSSELKQQQVEERIIAQLAEQLKTEPDAVLKTLQDSLLKEGYDSLFESFQAIVEGNLKVAGHLEKDLAQALTAHVIDRIAPRMVTIKGEFTITSFAPDGVELVKKAFAEVPEEAHVSYAGGGRYSVVVTAKDYKIAEDVLKQITTRVKETMADGDEVAFERTDKR